jgi:hypothetical protein
MGTELAMRRGDESLLSSVRSDFGLAPPKEGAYDAVVDASIQQLEGYTRLLRESTKKTAAFESVREEWRKAIFDRIGADNWKMFTEFSRNQRAGNFGLGQFTPVPEGWEARRKAKQQSIEESVRLLEKAGIGQDEMKRLHGRFAGDLAHIGDPKIKESKQLKLVPQDKVPEDVLRGKGNPWTIYYPPYAGWWWSYSWWRAGGHDPDLYTYVDVGTGAVGHRSDWPDYDASDFDAFNLTYDTEIGVWYWPPRAGLLDVWIRARSASARSHFWLDDEWGWSDSHSRVWSYMTVNVSPVAADKDYQQIWWAWAKGNPDDTTYQNDWYTPGSLHWFHLSTSMPIPANAWTLLKVGTHDYRWTWLNDVSTWQMMRNRWLVEQIWVDVL